MDTVSVATLLPRRGIKLLPWCWMGRNSAEGKHLIINLQADAAPSLPLCSGEGALGSLLPSTGKGFNAIFSAEG